MSGRPEPAERVSFKVFYTLATRWSDNDVYGHVNNVAYYSYFDTAVNRYLIEEGGLRPGVDQVVGYVVHSSANYFAPASYPEALDVGLRVLRLGDKSVTWEVGVFSQQAETSCVTGSFTHAFVDRTSGRAASVPPKIRSLLEPLLG